MSNSIAPANVLAMLDELDNLRQKINETAGADADFAFKWAERNGGVPKTERTRQKLFHDLCKVRPQMAIKPDDATMQDIHDRFCQWAEARQIDTEKASQSHLQQFDDETGVMTAWMDKNSGWERQRGIAHRVGQLCGELATAAVAFGCEDTTVAALTAMRNIAPEIANGRLKLNSPGTWTEARLQANAIVQSESIAGIPLIQAWEVALIKLHRVATEKAGQKEPLSTIEKTKGDGNTRARKPSVSPLTNAEIATACRLLGVQDSEYKLRSFFSNKGLPLAADTMRQAASDGKLRVAPKGKRTDPNMYLVADVIKNWPSQFRYWINRKSQA